ncbi:response regulator [Candidatus Palauibacter sp.]|uniref:response regulator transcription factor n=1 Tax=Candidatus Palauibacter sp. TaxID=3101350 RepID=UPI003B52DCE0
MMVKALLVDDHAVVRAGLRALLEASGRVDIVGEASSGEEAVTKARKLEPDIVIMDLAMPGMDGIQATRRIAALGIETKVLVLTVHDEDEFLLPALDAGASGFLNKSAADTDLMGAVEAIARGHAYLPRRAAALIARREARRRRAGRQAEPEPLSDRERTVIELTARGFSAAEAGREMCLSRKTVEGYISRAKSKLGLANRRDIVRFALESGLLRTEAEE